MKRIKLLLYMYIYEKLVNLLYITSGFCKGLSNRTVTLMFACNFYAEGEGNRESHWKTFSSKVRLSGISLFRIFINWTFREKNIIRYVIFIKKYTF